MSKKLYWGIAALIILMIATGGFIYWQWTEVQQLKEQVAQDEKRREEYNKMVSDNDLPPAEPGKKWVPHDDHFHQVPIDAPDTWQEEPTHSNRPTQAKQTLTFTKPLTFHKELLETNPLKALHLQCKERGHWSAKWIAEFSSDNHQAQALARTVYLNLYYDSLYESTGEIPISDAEYNQLGAELSSQFEALDELPINHQLVLMRIGWPYLSQKDEPVMSK